MIQSSVASPLGALAPPQDADVDDADEAVTAKAEKPEKVGSLKRHLIDQIDNINLARDLDDVLLSKIGQAVVFEYDLDENSRSEWLENADKAMKFATQAAEEKQYPWPRASNIIFPLITQAAVQFQARTYPALIQNRNVVKGVVWGTDKGTPVTLDGKPDGQPKLGPDGQPMWLVAPGEKRLRADRIGEHMSYQLLEEMPEWEPQTDQLLLQIPIMGGAVRKTYRDPAEDRNYSLFVSLKSLVWNYTAPSFEAAPRHSELLWLYPNEITERERCGIEGDSEEGMFLPLEYGPGDGAEQGGENTQKADQGDPDAPHLFIEQHRRWDLDKDGYAEPYVVTVHKRSAQVVRIVARYDEEGIDEDDGVIQRITPTEHYTLIPFLPSIDGGSYPTGFGHLLRPLNDAINTTLNQMFDAGHLQNAGGGFVSDQLGIASGQVNFQVGKYVRVNSKGQSIRDAVFPLPFQGPSTVLFQLLGVLITAGKEVASIQDVLAGDASVANAPPTTVLALIEQGMKVYTAIHKRIYRAFKSEFQKLYRLNRLYLKDSQRYRIGDEWREITPDDYRLGGGVEPIADPTMTTDMQRLGRAQILMDFKGDPLVNQTEIRRRLFEAAQMDRIDELLTPEPNPMGQQAAQLEMAMKQAELGRTRAAEMKDQTQAFLNLALARAKATGPEEQFIASQLQVLRLHIEAINAGTRAAMVDHKFHDTHTKALIAHADRLAEGANPGPDTSFPVPPSAPAGNDAGGVQPVAPQPGDGGVPPVPGGPGEQLPPGGP